MAKKKGRKTRTGKQIIDKEISTIREKVTLDKTKADEELAKSKLDWKIVGGAAFTIIGVLLILFNLSALLMAIVGIALVYFGVRLLGYQVRL